MPARFPSIMDDTVFAFPVARLRVLETRLLDRQRYERMLDAADAGEVYRILAETEYGESISETQSVHDFEVMLGGEMARVYKYVGGFVTEAAIMDSLRIRYDFHNLKVLVKERLLAEPAMDDAVFTIGAEPVSALSQAVAAVFSGRPSDLHNAYKDAVKEAREIYEETSDPQQIDVAIDRKMFEFGISYAGQSKSDMLIDIWRAWADLANFKSFARAAYRQRETRFASQVLVPGGTIAVSSLISIYTPSMGAIDALIDLLARTRYAATVERGLKEFSETRSFTLYEKLADNFVLRLLDGAKRISLGLEPIIAYMLAKENEIKNLRIILTGKINRLPAEAIRERLRDVYV